MFVSVQKIKTCFNAFTLTGFRPPTFSFLCFLFLFTAAPRPLFFFFFLAVRSTCHERLTSRCNTHSSSFSSSFLCVSISTRMSLLNHQPLPFFSSRLSCSLQNPPKLKPFLSFFLSEFDFDLNPETRRTKQHRSNKTKNRSFLSFLSL